MIWLAFAAALSGPSDFGPSMVRYMTCLSAGLPSDLSGHDLQTRARIYRAAASRSP